MTPVAAVEERAKVEHANDVKEGVPFVKARESIKRPHLQSSTIPSKKSKPTTPQNPRKRKKSSKPVKRRKVSGKKKQKSVKKQRGVPGKKAQSRTNKQFKIDSYRSIFKQ